MAKITSRGMRAKGKYFPKYLIRSGISFFEKNKKGVDLIKKVVRDDKNIIISTLVIFHLDFIFETIKA